MVQTSVISSFVSNPLTTTYTRPDDCSGIHRSKFISGVDIAKSCMPDGFNPEPTAFFSPGFVCPDGYVSACHDNGGIESITTVTCCPTVEDVTLSCVTESTLDGAFTDLFCTWIAPEKKTSMPITISDSGKTSTEMVGYESPGGLNAYGVRMVYESSDLEAATMTAPPDSDDDDDDEDGDNDGGLSTGGKIAVGVAVPVGVLALAALGFLAWRHRKKKAAAIAQDESKPPALYGGRPIEQPPQEMPVNDPQPVELPAEPQALEADTPRPA